MPKSYEQRCPVAHALDLVGDRWALLVVRELMRGPKRYTDLGERLPGIGTNILATRLRDLEGHGVVRRSILAPPAASKVYELTEYGRELRPAMRALAEWGARSLGPPTDESGFFPGWLGNLIDSMLAPHAPAGRLELRALGDETASLVDGEAVDGPVERPDVVVEGKPVDVYSMVVTGRPDQVHVHGDKGLLAELLRAVQPTAAVQS